jgi:hypothetical protein
MNQKLIEWFRQSSQGLSFRIGMKVAMKAFPFLMVFGGCAGLSFERDYSTFYSTLLTLFISYAFALYLEPQRSELSREQSFPWKVLGFFSGIVLSSLCLLPASLIIMGLFKAKILRA